MSEPLPAKYKRVLLKLSGEAFGFSGKAGSGISIDETLAIARTIKRLVSMGVQLGAAEEVAPTDDDRHLRAGLDDRGDLPCHGLDHIGIDPDGATAEHLAAELEQHAAESGAGVGADPDVGHPIRPGRPRSGRTPSR